MSEIDPVTNRGLANFSSLFTDTNIDATCNRTLYGSNWVFHTDNSLSHRPFDQDHSPARFDAPPCVSKSVINQYQVERKPSLLPFCYPSLPEAGLDCSVITSPYQIINLPRSNQENLTYNGRANRTMANRSNRRRQNPRVTKCEKHE